MTQHQLKNNRTKKYIHFLRILIVSLWALFLLINTWTESLRHLLIFNSVRFKWVSDPNYMSFFYYDISVIHSHFVIVKLGHFFGFAFMYLLLFNLIKNHKSSIAFSIIFAYFTEFFQLFFGRDGRFYDFIIDTLGIILTYIILKKNIRE